VNQTFAIDQINSEQIYKAATEFIGNIQQVPPIYSAIKKDGVRLYEHARNGVEVKIKERNVIIHEFEITRIELPEIDFRVVCSKGTYIRSLANDMGKALNNGAYLSKLTRTKIGGFCLKKAIEIDDFTKLLTVE
jgi:tRNA pseudouridine55 synthase